MNNFNAIEVKDRIVAWIREWFEQNGKGCTAVIGISGGTDSSVVAALCVEALGKDRVFGVLMPQNTQSDINYAHDLCSYLDIKNCVVDIGSTVDNLLNIIWVRNEIEISRQTEINLPPRIRMATLYAVSQSMNGRVANTCNLSEDWIGYSTRYGDSVGDFSPLSNLTKTEVKEIGLALGLPTELVYKIPADGLCGKTDEDNFGFTYDVLNKYIRTGVCENEETRAKIDEKHYKNLFKLQSIPSFPYMLN
jgi:NAD+ synthase